MPEKIIWGAGVLGEAVLAWRRGMQLGVGEAACRIRDFTFWRACRGWWGLSMVDFGGVGSR